MIVFRIQDKNNKGPMQWDAPIRNNVRHHKDPEHDMKGQGMLNGKPFIPQLCGTAGRFGWDSIYDVYGFIKFPRAVDEAGYRVVVYDVDETKAVRYPDGQVFFYMEDATPVGGFMYSDVRNHKYFE